LILYKYREDNEYTEKLISERKVWLSNAAGLNDPFECKISEIASEWIQKRVHEGRVAHMSGFCISALNTIKEGELFFGVPPDATISLLNIIKKAETLDTKYLIFRDFMIRANGHPPSDPKAAFDNFDLQLQSVGIFSLTGDPINQLMWAHYGAESKGLTLGFEVRKDTKLSDPDHCLEVKYQDELPKFEGDGLIAQTTISLTETGPKSTQRISFSDPTFKTAISTKPTHWDYEKEWRYIEETSGAFSFPAPLTEVVFGLRCPDEVRKKYIKLILENINNEVSFFEVVNPKNTNKMVLASYMNIKNT